MQMDELIQRVVAHLGLTQWDEKRGEWLGNCPFHEDEHPSFRLNPNKQVWYCYACDPRGDEARITTLAKRLGLLGENEDVNLNPYSSPAINSFGELVHWCHQHLLRNEKFVSYLQTYRCLTEAVIRKARLGLWYCAKYNTTFLVIPMTDVEGKWVNAKLRRLEEVGEGELMFSSKDPRYLWASGLMPFVDKTAPTPTLYPQPRIFNWQRHRSIWIVGGELDALAAWSVGIPAVASTKSETHWQDEHLALLPEAVVFALDNEPATQAKVPHLVARYFRVSPNHIWATIVKWTAKDLTDCLREATERKVPALLTKMSVTKTVNRWGTEIVGSIFPTLVGTYYSWVDRENLTIIPMFRHLAVPLLWGGDKQIGEYLWGIAMNSSGNYEEFIMQPSSFADALTGRKTHVLIPPNLANYPNARRSIGQFLFDLGQLCAPPYPTYSRIGLYLRRDDYDELYRREFEAFLTDDICFVFANRIIPHKDGRFLDILQQNRFASVIVAEEPQDISPLVSLLPHIYPEDKLYPILAWFTASYLSTYIRTVNQFHFPVLSVSGQAGTGKTSIVVDVMQKLFAPSPHLASRQTASTMRKYTDMSSLPLVLDEFTPRRWGEYIEEAKQFIHYCYEMIAQQVSRSATELEAQYRAYTPLCIVGEDTTFAIRETALADRTISVQFVTPTFQLPSIYTENFILVRNMSDLYPSFRLLLAQFLIDNKAQWDEWWREAKDFVGQKLATTKQAISARKQENLIVLAFGWKIFREFVRKYGGEELPDVDEVFPYFFLAVQRSQINLQDNIMRFLMYWDEFKESLLIENEDWGKVEPRKNSLPQEHEYIWINIRKVVDKLRNKYRNDGWLQLPPHIIRQEFEEAKRQGREFIINANYRTTYHWGCVLIDWTLLQQIPPFSDSVEKPEQPQLDLQFDTSQTQQNDIELSEGKIVEAEVWETVDASYLERGEVIDFEEFFKQTGGDEDVGTDSLDEDTIVTGEG